MIFNSIYKLKFLLESRQCKVIDGLRQIYPIVLLENGHYSIRGAELPMDPYSTNRSLTPKLYSIDAFHLNP